MKNPVALSAHALSPAILFKFSVLPVPLSKLDKSSEVTSVSLKVNGVEIDDVAAHEIPATPGEYQISVDLSDPKLFSPPPNGSVPVRIVATNKRGTTRTSDTSFDVDSLGPVIQIVSPATNNQFVGGKVTLSFTVTDTPAGVDPATVKVVLNSTPFFFDPKNGWANPTPNAFSFTFDTKQFGVQIQLAVNIRADDLAGNSSDGASILYYLDNVAPIIDMAPPALQEVQYGSTQSLCSEPFFPLGDSPKDGDVVKTLTRPRALLWDLGNSAEGQDAFYYSDIDNSNTNTVPHLYFQPDTTKPLLKNADPSKHGAVCDAIANENLPLVTLVPLQPSGSAFFPASAPPHAGICVAGTETTPSKPACTGSDIPRVIQHEGAASQTIPAIYVIAPDSLQCSGTQYQLTNAAPKDGWVCAAVSAVDKTGNRSVSAPIRLCLDSDTYPGSPECATTSVAPPTCVDDCVPPSHFTPPLGLIARPH
ncbi:MAG: Ig-like domain-containing protein [Polyangiaceae bacterium]